MVWSWNSEMLPRKKQVMEKLKYQKKTGNWLACFLYITLFSQFSTHINIH